MAGPLTIRFASDVEGARRGMASLAASVAQNVLTINSALSTGASAVSTFQRGLSLLPAAIGGVAAAFAGFALASAAIDQARERIEKYVELVKSAEQSRVGIEFFQRFTEGAKAAKLEVEDFEKAMARAAEASTARFNQGSAIGNKISEFTGGLDRVINPQSPGLEAFIGAQDQEQRIRAVLQLMKEIADAGRELAALDLGETMFGAKFIDNIRQGKVTIDELLRKLDQANPKNLIAEEDALRAKDLSDRLEEANKRLSEALGFSLSLATAGQSILAVWTSIVEKVADFAQTLRSLNIPWERLLQNTPAGAVIVGGSRALGALGDAATQPGADLAALNRQARQDIAGGFNPTGVSQADLTARDLFPGAPGPTRRPSDATLFPSKQEARESLDAVERYIGQLERAAEVAKAEAETVGKTTRERELAVAMARAEAAAKEDVARKARESAELTKEEVAQITAAAEATAKWKDKAADLNQQLRLNAEAMRFFGQQASDALADIIIDGRKASEVLEDLGRTLTRAVLNSALTGTGPLAGLLGTAAPASAGAGAAGGIFGALFSGLKGLFTAADGGIVGPRGPVPLNRYAGGGIANTPQLAIFGEGSGKEAFVPLPDGRSIPVTLRVPNVGTPAAGGSVNNIEIVTPPGATVRQERKPNSGGGEDIRIFIDRAVTELGATPGSDFNNLLTAHFGLREPVGSR